MMKLSLQFGYGMMGHTRQLLKDWKGGCVILSPRDLKEDQLVGLGADVCGVEGCECLIDPQFYLPYGQHDRLSDHGFWPDSYDSSVFWSGAELRNFLKTLKKLNDKAGTRAVILPALLASKLDEDWLSVVEATIEEAKRVITDKPIVATIALGPNALSSTDAIEALMDAAEGWDVSEYYVVAEHPMGGYFVDDPLWLGNLLDLLAGLKLLGKRVTLGYCNQQLLAAAACKVDAIASGTWMNVRCFSPARFDQQPEDGVKQRSTWYYCARSFCEYKIPYLEIAFKAGVLDQMETPTELGGSYAEALFSGVPPISVEFTEQQSFRHYLDCLSRQVKRATKDSFDATVSSHLKKLDAAEELMGQLEEKGVRGAQRDFSLAIDANRSALATLVGRRGPLLRRRWASL